jgi:hypothetical protein
MDNMTKKYEDLQKRLVIVEQQIKTLALVREQLLDDIEMAEMIMMYQSNKEGRLGEIKK